MTLFQFLHQRMGARIYWVALLSLVTGISNTLMIKTINDVVNHGASTTLILIFGGAVGTYLLASRVFNSALLRATQRSVYDMREDILSRVMACDLERFEKAPNQNIYTAITEDTTEIARSPEILSSLLTAGFTVAACFVYLCWLSIPAFLLILVAILIGGGLYTVVANRAERDWERARLVQDDFFRAVDHLLRGFKELKINDEKRNLFFKDDLLARCRESYDWNVRGGEKYIQAVIVSGILIYGVLGAFSFIGRSQLALSGEVFGAIILVMLYITPAIQQTVDLLPTLDRFSIAIHKIKELQAALAGIESHRETPVETPIDPSWRELRLEEVTFAYPSKTGEPFRVGPINLTLHRGRTHFIIGGNGSGKTTLFKILLGLYQPESGRILLDGKPLAPGGSRHRALFAPLFADFHLFDRFYGQRPDETTVAQYLALLEIQDKVQLSGQGWSTMDLSQGQRKRLGLLQALLEKAPVLVMDEFAADQDPRFRARFYQELLPQFKTSDKTIIAITHDESYFHTADQVIHMCEGRVVGDELAAPALF